MKGDPRRRSGVAHRWDEKLVKIALDWLEPANHGYKILPDDLVVKFADAKKETLMTVRAGHNGVETTTEASDAPKWVKGPVDTLNAILEVQKSQYKLQQELLQVTKDILAQVKTEVPE